MPTIGPRGNQGGDKNRPYWVWIWQGDLEGGDTFGGANGWTRFNNGKPNREVDFGDDEVTNHCVRNCTPRTRRGNQPNNDPPPEYETVNNTPSNPIPNGGGREPIVEAVLPKGLPGQTGAIQAFFPPITVDVDCQQTPLRIEGGQIETIYDLTLTAEGFLREETTNKLLIPFSVSTVTRGPGPIIGYTVSQYTFGNGSKDLRSVVYYVDAENNLGDFSRNFGLSLSTLLGENPNMTIEGNQYYFDIETITLDNLVRADGLNDSCGTSACDVTFEVNYYLSGAPSTILTDTFVASGIDYVVTKLTLSGLDGEPSRQVLAHNIDDSRVEPIRQATPSQFYLSAPILDIDCTYDVNGQIPGCFIESPETCQVTISDRSGVLFQQTYFGRPEIRTSSEYTDEFDEFL